MDIKQLRYFMGVLEAKSITKAAEHLYVAQPALGLQIRKLEEELGVELFVRHSRGVAPLKRDCCSRSTRKYCCASSLGRGRICWILLARHTVG